MRRTFCNGVLLLGLLGLPCAFIFPWMQRVDLSRTPIQEQYTYIIVGAGSAGGILAARLTEDPTVQVLLVEAGPDYDDLMVRAPAGAGVLQNRPTDWAFRTTPQLKAGRANVNHSVSLPQGKQLGGSSQMNYLAYARGNAQDYNRFAEITGNDAWRYENVLPFFKRQEKVQIPELRNSPYHGTSGEIGVSYPKSNLTITPALVQAFVDVGLPFNADYNGEQQLGSSPTQMTALNSVRQSTAIAVLRPLVGNRPNLHISTESLVEKVIIEKDADGNPFASGIKFRRHGVIHTVRASREVVISAGAIRTPQLLMLSGIGARDELEEKGIPVVVDSPGVGKNLLDHLGLRYHYTIGRKQMSDAQPDALTVPWATSFWSLLQWYWDGSGPLSTCALETIGFHITGLDTELPPGMPDLQFHSLSARLDPQLDINLGTQSQYHLPAVDPDVPGFVLIAYLLHPRSKGNVTLRSTDPADHPIVETNYLADPLDRQILLEGAKLLVKAAESPSLVPFKPQLQMPKIPECEAAGAQYSDEHLLCEMKYFTTTIYHPLGTAAMGKAGTGAVVDGELKVHGVRRLRVADLSIYPRQISGNTQTAAMLAGEMAAFFIKQSH